MHDQGTIQLQKAMEKRDHMVTQGDFAEQELSQVCLNGHMLCSDCHCTLYATGSHSCPVCRANLLAPTDNRSGKLTVYSTDVTASMTADMQANVAKQDWMFFNAAKHYEKELSMQLYTAKDTIRKAGRVLDLYTWKYASRLSEKRDAETKKHKRVLELYTGKCESRLSGTKDKEISKNNQSMQRCNMHVSEDTSQAHDGVLKQMQLDYSEKQENVQTNTAALNNQQKVVQTFRNNAISSSMLCYDYRTISEQHEYERLTGRRLISWLDDPYLSCVCKNGHMLPLTQHQECVYAGGNKCPICPSDLEIYPQVTGKLQVYRAYQLDENHRMLPM